MCESDILEFAASKEGVGLEVRTLSFVSLPYDRIVRDEEMCRRYKRVGDTKVEDAMNEEVVAIDVDDTMETALETMVRLGFNRLPVMSKKKLVGMIARQDILVALCREMGDKQSPLCATGDALVILTSRHVPCPGCGLSAIEVHVLASGSDGNCTVIASEDTTIMIDAGISGRRIAKLMEGVGLDPRELDAILLTHEHSDHVSGAGILSRKYKVPVCCNENTLVCSNIGAVHGSILSETHEQVRHRLLPRPSPSHLPQRRRAERLPCHHGGQAAAAGHRPGTGEPGGLCCA